MNTKERLKYRKKVLYNLNSTKYLEKHKPKTVFKYRSGCGKDSETKILYDIDALLNQYLWEPNAISLNDPYDCAIRMDFHNNIVKELGLSSSDIEKLDKKVLQTKLNELEEKWKQQWHIISFSERVDSILMWSHYANEHKGFCVEYDTSQFKSQFFPVIYRDKFDNVLKHINTALCVVLTKATDWAYEREWRIINQTEDFVELNGFKYYAPKPLAIYMGCRIDENSELKNQLIAYAKTQNVKLHQMKLQRDSYILKAEEISLKDINLNTLIK